MVKFHILRYYNCTHPQSPLSLGTSGESLADQICFGPLRSVLSWPHSVDQASLVAQTVKKKKKKKIHLQCRRPGFDSWIGKIPWRRAWQPTPVLLPGESPWTEEPGGLQSIASQKVRYYWATKYTCFVDQPHLWVPCPLAFRWSHGTPSGANQGATKHLSLQSHTWSISCKFH